MDERQLLRIVSAGRVAIGGLAVALPGVAGRRWVGSATAGTKVFARAFGVRDVALGIATMQALDAGRPVRDLVGLGTACDAVDAAATLLAVRTIGLRKALPAMAIATSAAVIGAYASTRIED